ncbi:MAG: hypothetical protein ACO1OO_17545 [Flavisolibacter sp.]
MQSPHNFHIPVMGLAYTIDSPQKVARFGISSVVSIVEDRLIEMMRSHYSQQAGLPYTAITTKDEDYRARRITAYLNLVNTIVNQQVDKMKASAFETGSDLVKYFELLPDNSPLKQDYWRMNGEPDAEEKERLQAWLKAQVVPGAIDVNIMTKLDKNNFDREGQLLENGSDAIAAIRGYLNSQLVNSSVVLSAGMNPRLFNYMENFPQLQASEEGVFEKKVTIKVSDYRSALIQGKYLAKKGIWVSEFRIESGLNCGGHAFATDGYLLGPILQEFADHKEELSAALFALYKPARDAKGGPSFDRPHPIRLTVQGGIGTYEEATFLQQHYGVDSTGWGSPFLLCPEATTVDEHTLRLLAAATEEDISLSRHSPLGVRFYAVKGTTAEQEKQERIKKGKPGSPCTEKFLVSNTEFTEQPICTASHQYQKLKLAQLRTQDLTETEREAKVQEVLGKECLCVGLSNAAAKSNSLQFIKRQEAVTVCPGPNLAYFRKEVSLQEMTDHIYGRRSVLDTAGRPHMFLKELELYVSFLQELHDENRRSPDAKRSKQITGFHQNMHEGIDYYRSISEKVFEDAPAGQKQAFVEQLEKTEMALKALQQEKASEAVAAELL